ncbi:hypothetical protein [Methylibium sp.]|jgi:hypothetical protein|uniref:hypothetical protein n=1 Tax=Methylibium sp. TaxID=2067992 RepID=UPI003D0987C2
MQNGAPLATPGHPIQGARKTHAATSQSVADERPPAGEAMLELIGLIAIAVAAAAVYFGARRTRKDRTGGAGESHEKRARRRAAPRPSTYG